ncbi:helix-turn-helix transcriptional regulator [Streptomyces sp. DH24]|uniref:helix-turn-helix domain-containing protein n=1 Tax=Streptomyces sp. DH24 TaxID=3040123 RepID=UPI0024425463|nr:helix-turn-helix transcriptional regulator [Streptomyces sp. DH24]MDG9715498.1 helix-turn-helix transcriptional regulator [Streptomyces sp. DH24]
MTDGAGWDTSPAVLRLILGKQLEELRKRAGLSYAQAAQAIGVSDATIRRMENAKVARLRPAEVEKLLRVYGVTDEQETATFLQSVNEAGKRGWWHTYRDVMPDWYAAYLSLEQAATQIRAYEPQFVHGLLQTEAYVRALLSAGNPHASEEATERRVALRMRRQDLLHQRNPPHLWVVMDETALRWPIGGPEVMRTQIDHLLALVELPHVVLQIMRFDRGPHPAMPAGAFHLFRFLAREMPDVVYLSGLIGDVYLDKQDDVVVYRETLDRLSAQAPSARATAATLEILRKEF